MEIREVKLKRVKNIAFSFFENFVIDQSDKTQSVFHLIIDYNCTKNQSLYMQYWLEEFCMTIKRLPNYAGLNIKYISPDGGVSTVFENTQEWAYDDFKEKLRNFIEPGDLLKKHDYSNFIPSFCQLKEERKYNHLIILTSGNNNLYGVKPFADSDSMRPYFILFHSESEKFSNYQNEAKQINAKMVIPIKDITLIKPFFEFGKALIPGNITAKYIGSNSIIFSTEDNLVFPLEFQYYQTQDEESNDVPKQVRTIESCMRFEIKGLKPSTEYIFKFSYKTFQRYKIISCSTAKEKKNNHIVKDKELAQKKIKEMLDSKLYLDKFEKILKECDLPKININLYGLKGAGKSNSICTLASICQGKFDDRLAPFATSSKSFTRKLETHKIPILCQIINFHDIFGIEIPDKDSKEFDPKAFISPEKFDRVPELIMSGLMKPGFDIEDLNKNEEKEVTKEENLQRKAHGLVIVIDSRTLNYQKELEILRNNLNKFKAMPYIIYLTHMDKFLEKINIPFKSEELYEHPCIAHNIKFLADNLKSKLRHDISPDRIFPVVNYTVPYDERDYSREFPLLDGLDCLIKQIKNNLRSSYCKIKIVLVDNNEEVVKGEKVCSTLDKSLAEFKNSNKFFTSNVYKVIHLNDNNRELTLNEEKSYTIDDVCVADPESELSYIIKVVPL